MVNAPSRLIWPWIAIPHRKENFLDNTAWAVDAIGSSSYQPEIIWPYGQGFSDVCSDGG